MNTPIASTGRRRAFTLAEVMIALGIVASVMVGMLAAVPNALKSIKESNNISIMGRIAQEVIGDVQMSEWDEIEKNFMGQKFPFDNEGLPYEGRTGQFQTYEVRVDLPKERASLGNNLEFKSDHMRKVKVEVEYLNNGSYFKNKEDRIKNTQQYSYVVANQNKLKVQ